MNEIRRNLRSDYLGYYPKELPIREVTIVWRAVLRQFERQNIVTEWGKEEASVGF
jgi:hypothetical protein